MIKEGQIVEILATSEIYRKPKPDFSSKKEELFWEIENRKYSLFDGLLLAGHFGLSQFQLGQRKGINFGGKKEPLYVIAKDEADNRLFVGAGKSHPGLFAKVFLFQKNNVHPTSEFNFDENLLEDGISVEISSPSFETKTEAMFYQFDNDIFLEFKHPISITLENHPIEIFYQNQLIEKIILTK